MKPNEENPNKAGCQGSFVTFSHRRWPIQRFKLGLEFFSLIHHRLAQLMFFILNDNYLLCIFDHYKAEPERGFHENRSSKSSKPRPSRIYFIILKI